MLALQNDLGSVPSLSVSWKSLRSVGISSFWRSGRIQLRICQVLDFSFLRGSLYCCFNFIVCCRSV
jgi:hypothetical protein